VVKRPDAFGQKIMSLDDTATRAIKGVIDVVQFGDKVAIIADKIWAAIKGQKNLKVIYGSDDTLENTMSHNEDLQKALSNPTKEPKRNDGDVMRALSDADEILDRSIN
jgi:isoquinoline 1-oxidoreductase beta subunit